MPIEPINDTTYEATLSGGDKVEIGDINADTFQPHIKLNRWGGECFLSLKPSGLVEEEEVEYEVEENKIKYKYKVKYEDDTEEEFESECYPLEPRTVIVKDKEDMDVPFTQNELGGLEFEIFLKNKPKTNQIVLNIETQGLKFYYQPELTQEEVDGGAVRPDNVVGSYAVYHSTRTNMHRGQATAEKYKCGKAFHIYRPEITDAEGNWAWGELSINEQAGTLTTIIPQEFLDSAIYPVSVDPNFGYETIGTAGFRTLWDYIVGSLFTLSEVGSATSLTMAIHPPGALQTANGAIYRHSSLALIGTATERNDLAWFEAMWWQFDFAPAVDLSADDYVLVGWGDIAGSGDTKLYYDAGASDQGHYQSLDYSAAGGVFPNPLVPTHEDRKYSIYCTFDAVGGGSEGMTAAMGAKMIGHKMI